MSPYREAFLIFFMGKWKPFFFQRAEKEKLKNKDHGFCASLFCYVRVGDRLLLFGYGFGCTMNPAVK
jgi:hypothetical protein